MIDEWIKKKIIEVKAQREARARALFETLPIEVQERQAKVGIEVLWYGVPDRVIGEDGLPGPIFWNVSEHPYLTSDAFGTLMVRVERQRGVFVCRVLAFVDAPHLGTRLNKVLAVECEMDLVLVGEDQPWVEMASFNLRKPVDAMKVARTIVKSGRILYEFIYPNDGALAA